MWSAATWLMLAFVICPAQQHFRAEVQPVSCFTVEGQLECKLPGGVQLHETFVVAVSNSTWSISIAIPERPEVRSLDQVYDGDVLSSLTRFATNAAADQTDGASNRLLKADSVASVERSDVPNSRIGTYAGPLWLAFASHRSFQDNRNGLLPLAWHVNDRLRTRGFRTPAMWRTNASAPHLPEEVDYFFVKEQFAAAQGVPSLVHALTGSTSSKRLWASYRAGTFTNIDHLSLPLSFHYEQYEPMARDAKPPLVFSVDDQVTAVRPSITPVDIKAALGQLSLVEDGRLSAASPSSYVVANGVVPETSNPALQRMNAAAKKVKHGLNIRADGRRTETYVTLALVIGVLSVVVITYQLWKWRRSSRKMR